MWNAGYNSEECQNGYRYNNEFNSYQHDNRYSDFYEQQQPAYHMSHQPSGYQEPYFTSQQPDCTTPFQPYLCPDYYQPPSLQEPYFTSSEQYYPPQHEDHEDRLRAMMQQMLEEQNKQQENINQLLEEANIRQARVAQLMAYNEMMDNQFDPPVASESDQIEVLSNDIEFEVVDEDVNDEDNAENIEKSKNPRLQAKADRPHEETDRPSEHQGCRDPKADRLSSRPIGQANISGQTSKNSPETDRLPPEAAHKVDSTCLDSFEDGIDSSDEYVILMYDLVMGEGLNSEQRARLHEVAQAFDTPVPETEIFKSKPPPEESLHHEEPPSTVTYIDHALEQSKPEDQQLLVINQVSVGLGNKRKLVSPCTKTDSETSLLKRHSNTPEHLLGKESTWGRKKNFELTGEGDYGGYPSGIVMNEIKCDPTVKGRYLGRSYGGFRDQFYIDPGSSTGGIWNQNEYHGPWFND